MRARIFSWFFPQTAWSIKQKSCLQRGASHQKTSPGPELRLPKELKSSEHSIDARHVSACMGMHNVRRATLRDIRPRMW